MSKNSPVQQARVALKRAAKRYAEVVGLSELEPYRVACIELEQAALLLAEALRERP